CDVIVGSSSVDVVHGEAAWNISHTRHEGPALFSSQEQAVPGSEPGHGQPASVPVRLSDPELLKGGVVGPKGTPVLSIDDQHIACLDSGHPRYRGHGELVACHVVGEEIHARLEVLDRN